jgi:hypothetical protein
MSQSQANAGSEQSETQDRAPGRVAIEDSAQQDGAQQAQRNPDPDVRGGQNDPVRPLEVLHPDHGHDRDRGQRSVHSSDVG